MSIIEIAIFITGIVYVILAARNNSICWYWGILSCALLAYVSFTSYLLYADGFLQLIYVVMGFVGLYQWKNNKTSDSLAIKKLDIKYHVLIICLGVGFAFLSGYLLQRYSGAFATYIDSFTTVFGLIATVLLIQKYMGNWIYWIFIDIIMAIVYVIRGQDLPDTSGYATSALMIVYAVVSIYGLLEWRRIYVLKE